MEKQLLELPYNAVKINLNNLNCLSKAFDIVDRARKLNLPIILDTSALLQKNQFASIDIFESDFAVGIGAVQLHGNGLFDTHYNLKLTRLQEIIQDNNTIPYVGPKFRSGPDH
jgi:hypothetical protein